MGISYTVCHYLQSNYNDWVVQHGLDRLTIHRDGTFELKFCPPVLDEPTIRDESERTPSSSTSSKEKDENEFSSGVAVSEDQQQKENDKTTTYSPYSHHSRIWTSYDEPEKKHWLTVYKTTTPEHGGAGRVHVHERYLLQDNLVPTWTPDKASFPKHVHDTVDSMIRAIDQSQRHNNRHQT